MRVHPSVSPSPRLWIRVRLCSLFNLFFSFFFLVGVSSVFACIPVELMHLRGEKRLRIRYASVR